jgi:mycothiol synthase
VTTALAEKPARIAVTIRPFTPDDYPDICDVMNAVYPEYPETPEEIRHGDETRDPKLKWARYVAVEDGRIVGIGGYGQSLGMYHPRKFFLDVLVHPEAQGRGLGTTLYDHIYAVLADYDPIAIRSGVRSDHERGIRFLTDRCRGDARAGEQAGYGGVRPRSVCR